jgi:DNA-binding XRE family transcriptional regulator
MPEYRTHVGRTGAIVKIKRIFNTFNIRMDAPFTVRRQNRHDVDVSALRQRFGERIRDIRLERRMVQDEFAELIGISGDHLSSIERGINAPSFEVLELIASKLNMTISELFDFSEEPGTRKRVKLPRKRTKSVGTKKR